jgi:hypothetical protein
MCVTERVLWRVQAARSGKPVAGMRIDGCGAAVRAAGFAMVATASSGF